ncbi:MAG: phosphoserine phosphatase [Ruminococcaceae bacterium]|nr:phosphoserine phosphatase [Oscillospiraceae bacterium]
MNIYDFDGTIYDGDSTVDFFLFVLKNQPSLMRYLPRQAKGFLLYGLKRIDKRQLKEHFFAFLAGIDTDKWLPAFWEQHAGKIYPWYSAQQQADDVIISASPEFLLQPICQKLGINHLIASRVDVRTGKFLGANCRGREKVVRLQEELGIARCDQFYSDSTSDLPLAQIAEQAFLIKKGQITEWVVAESKICP